MGVVLLGYRGSGKTSVGRALADRLWSSFVDTDEMIVKSAGRSIREIFESVGESGFRDLEMVALREALASGHEVVAIGGGAVLREENRAMLKADPRRRVYLRCDPEELLRRIERDARSADNRPALTPQGGGIEEVTRLLAEREPLYREVMTGELDVTRLSVDEVVVYLTRLM
jgi:shikimate kinase